MELTCGCVKMVILFLEKHYGRDAARLLVADTGMNLDYVLNRSNWISLSYYYRFLKAVVDFTGDPLSPLKAGRYAYEGRNACFGPIAPLLVRLGTVAGTYRAFVRSNHLFNRAAIAEVLSVSRRKCSIKVTYPHHHQDINNCLALQGVLCALPEMHGCPPARCEHHTCACDGATSCIYEMSWENGTSFRETIIAGVCGAGLGILSCLFLGWGTLQVTILCFLALAGSLIGRIRDSSTRLKQSYRNSEAQASFLEESMKTTEKLNESLQEQVEERTDALQAANASLTQAYSDLQESQARELAHQRAATIGVLASGMAHELNTPLNTIQMAVQGLSQHPAGSRVRSELMNNAWKAALRCSRIVKELLAFSREPQTVSLMRLHEVLDSALSVFESEKPDGISVVREFEEGPPVAHVDGAQIQQSLLNLLDNAADALGDHGIVTVRMRSEGRDAVVEVADNGPGIPADLQERIFEPFESTKRNTGLGLGLGLSIASELVKKNGGRIDLVSHPGAGACVTLYFPLVASGHESEVLGGGRALERLAVAGGRLPAEDLPSEMLPESEDSEADLPLDSIRILLVEDDPGAGLTLKRMLEWHNVHVVHVASGEQGLDAFDPSRFDAIVTDVLLGDITGVDILRAIRKQEDSFPVILLTGHDSIGSAIDALRLGAQDYIQKPLERIEDLITPVRKAVNHHKLLLASKALTEELRSSEMRFRSLAELLPETVFEADTEGRITFMNKSGMAQFGLTEDILRDGFYLSQGVPPEEKGRVERVLRYVVSGETVSGVEFTGKRRSGDTFPILAFSTPIHRDGAIVGARAIVVDISQQKESEKELLHYQETLREMDSQLQVTEERERCKLAADLHDSIAQLLVAANMRLSLMARKSNDPALLNHLACATEILTDAIQQTRSLVFQLSPPSLYSQGLQAAIQDLSCHMQPLHGLKVEFSPSALPLKLDERTNIHVFRAIRELLVNVAKHAKVKECSVSVTHQDHRICVTVEDKGCGFPVPLESHGRTGGGFGLFGIRERIRTIGGTLEIETTRGKGTEATISVPVVDGSLDNLHSETRSD